VLAYDSKDAPKDLRHYADYEVEMMMQGEKGKPAAFLREVIRLRKLVLKLTGDSINIPPNCS
jgi:hypothetical protein